MDIDKLTVEQLNECTWDGKKLGSLEQEVLKTLGEELWADDTLLDKFSLSAELLGEIDLNHDNVVEMLEKALDLRTPEKYFKVTELAAKLNEKLVNPDPTAKPAETDLAAIAADGKVADKLKRAAVGDNFLDQIKRMRTKEPKAQVRQAAAPSEENAPKKEETTVAAPPPPPKIQSKDSSHPEQKSGESLQDTLAAAMKNRRGAVSPEKKKTSKNKEQLQERVGKLNIDNSGAVANRFGKKAAKENQESTADAIPQPAENNAQQKPPVPPADTVKKPIPAPRADLKTASNPVPQSVPSEPTTQATPPASAADIKKKPIPAPRRDLEQPSTPVMSDTKASPIPAPRKDILPKATGPNRLTDDEKKSISNFCNKYRDIQKNYSQIRKHTGHSVLKLFERGNKNRESQIERLQKCIQALENCDSTTYTKAIENFSKTLRDVQNELGKETRKLGESGMERLCNEMKSDFDVVGQKAQLRMQQEIEAKPKSKPQ